MNRLAVAGALLALGCKRSVAVPDELKASLGDRIAFCERMKADVVDWCVYQMLGDEARPGQDYFPLCASMRDPDARDACLEQFARNDESAKYGDICTDISQQRLRESCYLTVAERASRSAGTIQTVIQACDKAGDRRLHCLNHVPPQRGQVWRAWGSPTLMAQEINTLILSEAGIADQSGFGRAVGQAGIELQGAQGESLCHLFPAGEAGRGCEDTYQAWRSGELSIGRQGG